MMTAEITADAELVLELIGIVVFALSGAMLAIRKDFDVVGIVTLAMLTALGGGMIRDVLIGHVPPAAFDGVEYLLLPIGAAAVAAVAHPFVHRVQRSILLLDALGVALFTVNGTLIADNAGVGTLQAALLGVITGTGGGILRDVVARDIPLLVRKDSEIYAIPCALGAVIVASMRELEVHDVVIGVIAVAAIFGLRTAALVFHWRAPGAWRGFESYGGLDVQSTE